MLFDSLTLAVLAASAANAFLLPPEVSSIDIGIAESIAASQAIETADTPDRRTVKFDCPGCPILLDGHHGPQLRTSRPNHLELTFSVEHGATDKLAVNGAPVFPAAEGILMGHQVLDWKPHGHHGGPPPWARGGPPNIPPPWMRGHGDHHHKGGPPPWAGGRRKVVEMPLGFVLMAADVKDADTDMELVSLSFRVVEVGNTMVEGLPEIRIQLVKEGERLMIAKIDKVEVAKPECKTALCKLMTAIFGPPTPGKKCHGSGAGVAPPVEVEKPKVADEAVIRQKKHTWGQLIESVAAHILLPVLIGIVAGMAASL